MLKEVLISIVDDDESVREAMRALMKSLGSVRNLVRGAGFPSGSDEALAEHDGELCLGLGPFAGRHFPFPDDLAQDQEDELRRRLVVREMASRSHRAP